MPVRVQRRDGAILEEVTNVEELIGGQTMSLALCRIWCYVVELSEAPCERDVPGII